MKTSKKTLVLGLGVTGLACVQYLKTEGDQVIVNDSRVNPPGLAALQANYSDVLVQTGDFSPELLNSVDRVVVSPGIPLETPLIEHAKAEGIPVLGDIELFAAQVRAPIVAITGSNGKTTVTELVGLMVEEAGLKAKVCGNIGAAALEVLLEPIPDFYVLEVSSFQLDLVSSLNAEAAVVLNITEDHIDRHGNFANYFASKQHIYQGCKKPVVNADAPEIWQSLSLKHVTGFTLGMPHEHQLGIREVEGEAYFAKGETLLFPVHEARLQGPHHWANALAALALGGVIGLPVSAMRTVLSAFSGIRHRCQIVRERAGVCWVNDSKATNVGASLAALASFAAGGAPRVILIAGGLAKSADLTPLRDPIGQYAKQVILMGQDAPEFEQLLKGRVSLCSVASIEEAVIVAAEQAVAGDVVLLSPACASFDMFNNFEHRGDAFIQAVDSLP